VERANYETVKPNQIMIDIVNQLFEDGHIIKIFTSRGQTTGIDQEDLTRKQLKDFGIKHHELVMGKTHFDLLVDDRAIFTSDFIRGYKHLIE